MSKLILSLFLLIIVAYADDLSDAKIALSSGNYQSATTIFSNLANNGNQKAQNYLTHFCKRNTDICK